jgi:hypothetical protein
MFLFIALFWVTWKLVQLSVVVAMMAAAIAICMVAWIAVILFGLLMPGWTPRRACDGFLEFINQSKAHVNALK